MVVWKDAHKVDKLGAAARIYDDASVLPNDDSKQTGFRKTRHALLIVRDLFAVENESETHLAGWLQAARTEYLLPRFRLFQVSFM